MELDCLSYQVAYRDVKYPRVEFGTGELLLVLPKGLDAADILRRHQHWIVNKAGFIQQCLADSSQKELVERSNEEFRHLVYAQVDAAAAALGQRVNKVTYRKMKTKWASCSVNRNLTVNTLMRRLPEYLVEYIVFHETAHLMEKRHNHRFWKLISAQFPNHDALEKDLFAYWFLIKLARSGTVPNM
jgi:predicted metal-dependent hydrolase